MPPKAAGASGGPLPPQPGGLYRWGTWTVENFSGPSYDPDRVFRPPIISDATWSVPIRTFFQRGTVPVRSYFDCLNELEIEVLPADRWLADRDGDINLHTLMTLVERRIEIQAYRGATWRFQHSEDNLDHIMANIVDELLDGLMEFQRDAGLLQGGPTWPQLRPSWSPVPREGAGGDTTADDRGEQSIDEDPMTTSGDDVTGSSSD